MGVLLKNRDPTAPPGQPALPRCGGGGLSCGVRALAVWLLASALLPGQPSPGAVQEYQIKAAFLYNFAKFVDWPEEPAGTSAPLVIAVFGRDPFGPSLEQTVAGKTVNGRPLLIRRTSRLEELLPCHILFVSSSEKRRLNQIWQALDNASVLTVSDMEEFLGLGGAVGFLIEESKIRSGINLQAARRTGLRISSRLLSLAITDRN